MNLRFHDRFLDRYVLQAPLALAIERWFECEILSRQRFVPPVLDIGCGDGVFASVLFDDPIDLGIDPDRRELENAGRNGGYRELLDCPGSAIPRPDESFNTIFSNSVLEHIPEIGPVLREAHRLLSPSGRFYVTVPSDQFDHYSLTFQALSGLGLTEGAERFRLFFNRFWRHYHYFTPEGWSALFARHGFSVVAHQQYCPKNICLLNDFLAPFGGPSMVAKKLTGRWIPVKTLRRVYAPMLTRAIEPFLGVDPELRSGGILFFALERSAIA
jgi:SAM-dependent methyltransferase